MKEKISNGYKKYKELKQIPRYNALMKLGLYFLFFLVFGTLFFTNTTIRRDNPETPNDIKINTSKYTFTYKINNEIITGEKSENITFKYNDVDYTISDNTLSCDLEECNISFMYLFNYFSPSDLKKYIENGELVSKTEYNDSTLEYKYSINDDKIKEYFNSDLSFEILKKQNVYTINLENYNIFDKIVLEYK